MEMDNVFSIFTRKVPCKNLSMSKEEFKSYYLELLDGAIATDEPTHFDLCEDCSRRHFVDNRDLFENKISNLLVSLSSILYPENPNA